MGEKCTVQQLNIILTLKEVYLKAMGYPVGFNFLWNNCDIGKETVTVDMKLQSVYIKCG